MFDSLIKLVLNEDYKGMILLVNGKQNFLCNYSTYDINEYLNMFHVLIWMHEQHIITDHVLFMVMFILFKYKLEINNIANIKLYLKSIAKCKRTYMLLRSYYEVNLLEKKLQSFISKVKNSKGSIGKKYKDSNISIKKLDNLVFNKFVPVFSSFNGRRFAESLILPDVYFNQVARNNCYHNWRDNANISKMHWEASNSDEICNRLLVLTKTFGLNFLYFMQIPIISKSEYNFMTYLEKVKYYKKCISKLTSGFVNVSKCIENYNKMISIVDDVEYYFNSHYGHNSNENQFYSELFIDSNMSNELENYDADEETESIINSYLKN